MSDNYLRFIPTDPTYVADSRTREQARAYLATVLPDATEVTVTVTDEVAYIDQGANFERVLCPQCGHELDAAWWQNAMDAAYETKFAILEIETPCCSTATSLNDLHYDRPAGFARFVLEAMNPKVRDVEEAEVAALSSILGTPLRRIWAHY